MANDKNKRTYAWPFKEVGLQPVTIKLLIWRSGKINWSVGQVITGILCRKIPFTHHLTFFPVKIISLHFHMSASETDQSIKVLIRHLRYGCVTDFGCHTNWMLIYWSEPPPPFFFSLCPWINKYFSYFNTIVPDMLDPAMIPVQPLNMTANTVAKLMMAPVV